VRREERSASLGLKTQIVILTGRSLCRLLGLMVEGEGVSFGVKYIAPLTLCDHVDCVIQISRARCTITKLLILCLCDKESVWVELAPLFR
jgi:hypothetical protein